MYTIERFNLKSAIVATGMVLGMVGLSGCSLEPELKPGIESTVVDHDHDPAYTTVILAGKVPVMQYHSERWALEIEQCGRRGDEFADKNG